MAGEYAMDIGAWLRELELEKYAEAFAENGVDAALLPELTNDDLKDLGVVRLADRKRLLKAIALLSEGDDQSEKVSTRSTAPMGERRQVTVLFADLSNFTVLSSELGAEWTHSLLNRYFEIVDRIVESYGGTIDKHIGDNVMAVFGAPVAHTDDPERAVRAAVDIHAAMTELSAEWERTLTAHIGIASGQVVASGTGSDAHREYTVTGETVNLASRLQDKAGAGETLVSKSVQRATARIVATSTRGRVSVKGFANEIEVRAVNQLLSELTFDRGTAFVGRGTEMRQFSALLDGVLIDGRGHTLLVRGEPGIGKTRLIEEFVDFSRGRGFEPHISLVLDFGAGKGRDPVQSLLASLLDIPADGQLDTRKEASRRAVSDQLISEHNHLFLNDLLNLPQPPEIRILFEAMDSETRREGARETVIELIRSVAGQNPVLIVLEDIHWADKITMEHLGAVATAASDSRALLVMTTRVEGVALESDWLTSLGGCPATTMELLPLRLEAARELAANLAPSDTSAHEDLLKRAEGNPLFLEQLLFNASEATAQELPGTLQGLVLARVDRLRTKDHEAIQAAAVLGQRFSLDALNHLLGTTEYDCADLKKHRLVRPEGSDYLFAHALIRDGIYASLLQQRRRDLHTLAADFFSERDTVLKAEHLDKASSSGAPRAYLEAAQEQTAQFRYERAFQLVTRALEITPEAESFQLRQLQGDLLLNLGSISASINTYEEALKVANNNLDQCRARIGIAEGLRLSEQHSELIKMLNQAETVVSAQEHLPEHARIQQLKGGVHFTRGEIEACLQANTRSLEYARDGASPDLEAKALGGLGDAEFARGHMISAHTYFDQCIEHSRTHSLTRVVAANLSMRGQTFLYQNRLEEALDDCYEAAKLAEQIRQPRAEMIAAIVATYVLELNNPVAGREWVERSREIAHRLGSRLFEEINIEFFARFAAQEGDLQSAQQLMEKAIAMLRETESGMRFEGARSLACLALFTPDLERRRAALKEGEELLRLGATGHNYLWFYRDAMEVCLRDNAWDVVERYAKALDDYTSAEPLPWSAFFIRRGRALAAFGRGHRDEKLTHELRRLREEAEQVGLRNALPALEHALAVL
jgi:class 3 adenylate cyclase/tetratricopeptide (TPR) repeat protein